MVKKKNVKKLKEQVSQVDALFPFKEISFFIRSSGRLVKYACMPDPTTNMFHNTTIKCYLPMFVKLN